ncbi:short-chain dehydrogenase (plasmid) [Methylosinus trichosporium OB3b]|uniref:Short-chain dehydrogenase n=1 Tax=Methylosinus trichosporium (strain ATCC 35070 / NCIMB 11131 / UNIQEM 75 / OB3b) TaxID=595536 RepID=A0A2D2D715_METT3|nr:NnrS family protein [Methylosinus trichosporium]ATQ70806.1 short-chain dehydrogenase [Methylosinus trichosporium OB3b]
MAPIPRYRPQSGPAVLSAGFRPFFLLAAVWACLVVPASIASFAGWIQPPTAFPLNVWHAHEMAFGYGGAVVAGFLLTAIPNWTGRMPLQGVPLALLVLLWLCGRIAVLLSGRIGVGVAAAVDLSFPALFLIVIAREIIAGHNWRNLPMLGALMLLLLGNVLTHFDALGIATTFDIGNRLGVATLLMLVSLIGGRIVPSFTRNWLVKQDPKAATPASFDLVDRIALAATAVALSAWVMTPEARWTPWLELAAGVALAARFARWRGEKTLREPLLWVLHLGYGWLSLGLLLLGFNSLVSILQQTTALHALTVGAIGTMTLAVMTRASLGHTGRALIAGPRTTTIYALITLAAVLRLLAPLFGAHYLMALSFAGAAWSGAFGLFALFYFGPLTGPRSSDEVSPPI